MTVLFEEVELLARLEIEKIIEQDELKNIMKYGQDDLGFFIKDEITESFLSGVKFGVKVDDTTPYTVLEEELNKLKSKYDTNSDDLVKVMAIENLSEMFSIVFVKGMEWVMTHRALNNEF